MKIFAVLVLAAMVAYASATTSTESASSAADIVRAAASAAGVHYIGLLQETPDGPLVRIGEFTDEERAQIEGENTAAFGIPSCKVGKTWGNPVCFGKCVSRGHHGGYCDEKKCVCT